MKLLVLSALSLCLALPCAANELLAQSRDRKVRVERLPEVVEKEFEGCSCNFSSTRGKSSTVMAWFYGGPDPTKAAIQINGKTERQVLVGEKSRRKGGPDSEPRVGDSTEYRFSAPTSATVLSCKVSQTCWGTPGCEYIGYSCAAKVSSSGSQVTLFVAGGCGC